MSASSQTVGLESALQSGSANCRSQSPLEIAGSETRWVPRIARSGSAIRSASLSATPTPTATIGAGNSFTRANGERGHHSITPTPSSAAMTAPGWMCCNASASEPIVVEPDDSTNDISPS